MKIVLCHNYYQQRGGEDQSFELEAAMLQQYGHDVHLFTRYNDELNSMSRVQIATKTIWNQDSYREISAKIRSLRPDVLHSNNTFPLISPSVYRAAKDEGVPVVQSLRNFRLLCAPGTFLRDGSVCLKCLNKSFQWPAIVHRCYRNSRAASAVTATMLGYHRLKGTWHRDISRYIALTEFSRQKFVEGGLPADRISVKCNFVHPDPGVGRGEGNYAVFVGRLSVEKGVETLLTAWSKVPGSTTLKIIGEGSLADAVRAASARDQRIEYCGWQPLERVYEIIKKASCLIVPSIWFETFARTIVEAFAVGTPVVASSLGAMSELVSDGETGLLFEPGDAQDLSQKVQQILDNCGRTRVMRDAARAEFESKYTAAANYSQLMDVYRLAMETG